MKTFLLAATAAIALMGSSVYASPLVDSHDTTTNNVPVAVAGAAAGAAAFSGSVSGAAAINGPNTNTLVGGANTNLNNISGGDNRATVGNVSSSSGPSTSSATGGRSDSSATSSLGNLNSFGGSSTLIAPVTTTDVNSNLQGQALIDASKHSATSGSSSGVTGSGNSTNDNRSNATVGNTEASANDSSTHTQATTVGGNNSTVNFEASEIPRPAVNTAYAAPAVVGGGVCAYTPFSAGLSLRIVSGSASGAVIDKGCESRANADVLARLGYKDQATALLMQNEAVARAFETVRNAPKPVASNDTISASYGDDRLDNKPNTVAVLPTMPSNPVKGTMMPIPDSPRIPRN